MSDYNATVRPSHYIYNGKAFAIVRGSDGRLYAQDPDYELPAPHFYIPGAMQGGRDGMGSSGGTVSTVGTVISQLPIPGAQVVGTIISAIGSIFGGKDADAPLWPAMIQLRQQIADARNQLAQLGEGDPDPYVEPAGTTPPMISKAIANEVLNLFPGETAVQTRHKVQSADEHHAYEILQQTMAALQQQLGQAQQDAHDQQLIAEIHAANGGGGAAGDGSTAAGDQGDGSSSSAAAPAASTLVASAETAAPWLLGAAGIGFALWAMANR